MNVIGLPVRLLKLHERDRRAGVYFSPILDMEHRGNDDGGVFLPFGRSAKR